MTFFSAVVDNLMGALDSASKSPVAKEARPSRKVKPPVYCPHCGHRMRNPDGPKSWTIEEDTVLRRRIAEKAKPAVIAKELKRPVSSIRSRIHTLEIGAKL